MFTNPVTGPALIGASCVETPRQRLTRLELEWNAASDAAHLLWALNVPLPDNAAEIRAEYDRLTTEVRLAREWVEVEERTWGL